MAKQKFHFGNLGFDRENMNQGGNVTLFSRQEGQEGFQG
jgi:hypothetical protein